MINKENLEIIEKLYDFKYPEIYYRLLEDKMLDWGLTGSNWYGTEFPKLKNNPPLLLFGQDFEIIDSTDVIIQEIDDFSDTDDYRQTKAEFYYKFIPFGKTGAGDLYCFLLNKENEVCAIILVWHDANEVNILSENFEKFIFRQLLESVVEPYEEGLIMSGNFKENIENQLNSHRKYLTKSQIEVLEEIYSREINNGLLDQAEVERILMENGIEDETFEYQVE